MVYEYTRPRGPIAAMYSSPGPAYQLPSMVGSIGHDTRSTHKKQPAFQFGIRHKDFATDTSPGPIYSLPSMEVSAGALPKWSMSSRNFPPIANESRLNVPGPGAYQLSAASRHIVESAPAFTFGSRTKDRKSDTAPAPNNYTLPQLIGSKNPEKWSAPQFTLTGRSKVGGFSEDLQKTPGPGAYSITDGANLVKTKAPSFTITSRNVMPGDNTRKPGPGAHSLDSGFRAVTERRPAYSFGLRHSEYCAPVYDPADNE